MSKERIIINKIVERPFRLLTLIATAFGLSTMVDTVSADSNPGNENIQNNSVKYGTKGHNDDGNYTGYSNRPEFSPETIQMTNEILPAQSFNINILSLNPLTKELISGALNGENNHTVTLEIKDGEVLVEGSPLDDEFYIATGDMQSFLSSIVSTTENGRIVLKFTNIIKLSDDNNSYTAEVTATITPDNTTENSTINYYYLNTQGQITGISAGAIEEGYQPYIQVVSASEIPITAWMNPVRIAESQSVVLETVIDAQNREMLASVYEDQDTRYEIAASNFQNTGDEGRNVRLSPVNGTVQKVINPGESLPLVNPALHDLETLRDELGQSELNISTDGTAFSVAKSDGNTWYLVKVDGEYGYIAGFNTTTESEPFIIPTAVISSELNTQAGPTPDPRTVSQPVEQPTQPAIVAVPAEVPLVVVNNSVTEISFNGRTVEVEDNFEYPWRLSTADNNQIRGFYAEQISGIDTTERIVRLPNGESIVIHYSVLVQYNNQAGEQEIIRVPLAYSGSDFTYIFGYGNNAGVKTRLYTPDLMPNLFAAVSQFFYGENGESIQHWSDGQRQANNIGMGINLRLDLFVSNNPNVLIMNTYPANSFYNGALPNLSTFENTGEPTDAGVLIVTANGDEYPTILVSNIARVDQLPTPPAN